MNEQTNHRAVPFAVVAVMCGLQFVLGLVFAPYSCGWGLPVFIAIGFFTVLVLLSTPYFNRRAFNRNSRLTFGLMFAGIGVVTWVLTMFVAFGRSTCGM